MGFIDRFVAKIAQKYLEKMFPDEHRKIAEIVDKALRGKLTDDDFKDIEVPENVKDILLAISETIRDVEEERLDASEGLYRIGEKIGIEPEDLLNKVAKLYK